MTRTPSDGPAGVDPAGGADTGLGLRMFARYAYAPNKLGYCGPPESGALAEAGAGADAVTEATQATDATDATDLTSHGDSSPPMPPDTEAAVRASARRFSGAWPYLQVLARLHGLDDPLDHRVVEAYWLGAEQLGQVGSHEFGALLLEALGGQTSRYWKHLTPELLDEAAANHCFHVFGVYPWSRLLGTGADQPLRVLDSCRIRWGAVLSRTGNEIEVRTRRLTWDGSSLGLDTQSTERIRVATDGVSFVPDAAPGDTVALHWDRLTDRLRPDQAAVLEATTLRQLAATNRRLARESRTGIAEP
ncbi:MAG TPA: DUF6390 family protein [Actinocrinis sp.]|nr:DUF6390 family protein [Actinocrinis sp.]